MKTVLKVLVGFVGVGVLAFAGILFFTSGMSDTADRFFASVKSNDYDQAYSYLSEDFKGNTTKEQLEDFIVGNSLSDFKDASWSSRSVSGRRGELKGSINTESGGVVPVSVHFVKGDEDWKIHAIKKPASGLQTETESVEMPKENEQVKLVVDSMKIFAHSVNDKSMKKFHEHVSYTWQSQHSVEKLDEAYGQLYASGVDLTVLEQHSPTFASEADIDENGLLVLAGHYATQPKRVLFEQRYAYEGLSWKLLGFQINIE